jgi:hypothetical protein
MKNYINVDGNPGLVRDNKTHAILSTDSELTKKAKARKEKRRRQQDEFDSLKKDVNDMKSMLNQIVDKLNGA